MIFHSCVNLPEGTMAYGNTQQVPPIWVEVHVPSTPSRPMEVMLALDRSCFAFVIMVNGPRYAAENQVPAADLSNVKITVMWVKQCHKPPHFDGLYHL